MISPSLLSCVSICLVFERGTAVSSAVLEELTGNLDTELIIIDNSEHGLPLLQNYAEHDKRIKLVSLGKRMQTATALSKAFYKANKPYINILTEDKKLDGAFLKAALSTLERSRELSACVHASHLPPNMSGKVSGAELSLRVMEDFYRPVSDLSQIVIRKLPGLEIDKFLKHHLALDLLLQAARRGDIHICETSVNETKIDETSLPACEDALEWLHISAKQDSLLKCLGIAREFQIERVAERYLSISEKQGISQKQAIELFKNDQTNKSETHADGLRKALEQSLQRLTTADYRKLSRQTSNHKLSTKSQLEHATGCLERLYRNLLESQSWRLTRPARELKKLTPARKFRKAPPEAGAKLTDQGYISYLRGEIEQIVDSSSWKATRVFRALEKLLSKGDPLPETQAEVELYVNELKAHE